MNYTGKYSINIILQYIIYLFNSSNYTTSITNLRLQKYAFLIFKKYYKKTSQMLFFTEWEKWNFGTISPEGYFLYSIYGSSPIELSNNEKEKIKKLSLSSEDKKFIEDCIFSLNKYTIAELVKLTQGYAFLMTNSDKDVQTKIPMNLIIEEIKQDKI